MSIRNKLRKKETPTQEPSTTTPFWVENGSQTTKLLFDVIQIETDRIKELIKSGAATSPKTRCLVRAKIAKDAGFDKSILSTRRQYELCNWIDKKNEELHQLHKAVTPPKKVKSQKSKQDLLRENIALRKREASWTESNHRAVVEAFFNSNLLDDSNVLRQENSRLRIENRELCDTVARLRKLGRNNELKLAELWGKLQTSQKIELDWRLDSK